MPTSNAKTAKPLTGLNVGKDCLLPLADDLSAIVRDWNDLRVSEPEPDDIAQHYEQHRMAHADLALREEGYVDLACELQARMHAPLEKFRYISLRARQLLAGAHDKGDVPYVEGAIGKYVNGRYAFHKAHLPPGSQRSDVYDPELDTIENGYYEVSDQLASLVLYLRKVTGILSPELLRLPARLTAKDRA